MSAIAFEIVLILVLVVANGVFSGSEIAIVSARKVRLEQLAKSGNRNALVALKLANNPNDFLSTVQIGITLIGILSGALGGATIAAYLGEQIALVPLLAPYSAAIGLGLVVTVITYLSLVIGELFPKRVALNEPEQIACRIARPMRLLSRFTAPFVHILSLSTDALLKLLRIRASDAPLVTEAEIEVFIQQGTEAGLFEAAEQEMIGRVFRLGDRPVRALMTPRIEIDWLNLAAPFEETQQQIIESPYSRFPVCQETLNHCLGIVRVRSLLSAYLTGQSIDLTTMLQPPLYVAENIRALDVLGMFKDSGTHIALVADEYGNVEGLITLNDLTEAIFGDLPSAESPEEPMFVQRSDGSWLIDGLLPIEEFQHLFDRELLLQEESRNYHTLAGFVIVNLGRIPRSGDRFVWNNLQFEVADMDGTRVDKVLITQLPSQDVVSEMHSSQ